MAGDRNLNRRDFVTVVMTFLGAIITGLVGLPAIGFLLSPAMKVKKTESWIPLGPLENYPLDIPTLFSFTQTTVNGWERTVNSYGVYVIRGIGDQVRVFSNLCTHLSCRVSWKEDQRLYICPCHDGRFDFDGNVVSGPPPAPLNIYETKIEEGQLFIHFSES